MLTHLINEGALIKKENWRQLLWRYSPEYLALAMEEREWNGLVSATTVLRCPRQFVFKQRFPYAINPDDMAFAILGTKVHKVLESEDDSFITELPSDIKLAAPMSGIMDLVFAVNGEIHLKDNKTWGSFAVKKNMGLREETRPLLDEHGHPVFYKRNGRGYKAGDPRMEKIYIPDPTLAENEDVTMQLNIYRIMLEEKLRKGEVVIPGAEIKKHVSHLGAYCIVRDGNTLSAKNNGIYSATYAIPINKLPDEAVIEFASPRAKYLHDYMEETEFASLRELLKDPPRCGDDKETLGGWMCRKNCPVAYACKASATCRNDVVDKYEIGKHFDINTGVLRV